MAFLSHRERQKTDGAGAIPNSLPADDVNEDGASKSISTVVQLMASVGAQYYTAVSCSSQQQNLAATKEMLKTFASIVGSNNTNNWNKPFWRWERRKKHDFLPKKLHNVSKPTKNIHVMCGEFNR